MTDKKPDILNRDLHAKSAIIEIQTDIAAIEKDVALYEEKNFDKRVDAIDFIGFHIIDQIEEFLKKTTQPAQLISLKHRTEKIKAELEEMDVKLFKKLRAKIRTGEYMGQGFKSLVNEYIGFNLNGNTHREDPGYDNLDSLINGLFSSETMPEQTKALEPEMVYYQKTPARIVFELAEKAHFVKEDVFVDLGSGLGQAVILVNLITGITTKGVEFEPAFCEYARKCAAVLNLSNLTFINADARNVDYAEGTVFFMFTPFRGEILQDVLEILRNESLLRKIKIITYGPCTVQVALQSWLYGTSLAIDSIYKPAIFISL